MEKLTDFHTKEKMLIFVQKSFREAVIFVSVFLHLLTNRRLHTSFKTSMRFIDDNIWLVAQNLKDQNPKWFKQSFLSQII